ncbi:MAG TPA: trigger factor, partial [Pyrinomonadaceae bacterium]|nr:trigger factor [Pyrinomonadaceae bacterium]
HLENDEGLDKFGDQPLALHAHVEVLPEVELGEYKGVATVRRVRPVTDETVDEWVGQLRESSAALQPVEDRGAELGDTVTVDFLGKYVAPQEPDDINVEAVDVVLGGDGVVQEFTDNLLGVRVDDIKTFRVAYPEDFSSQGLAGKEIEYTATVTAVRRKELPELDDEWARSLSEDFESLSDLRAKLRLDLEMRAKFEADQRVRDEVMRQLIAAHQFEVPESLVKSQARRLLESAVRDMMQHGLDPRSPEFSWDNMQGVFTAQATEDLRGSILLERIAEAEQVEVADEEIEQEIERIAQGTRQSVEQVRAALTKQGGERSIADRLRHRKALDLIIDAAKVSDEEWREEEPPAVASAPAEVAAETAAAPADESAAAEQQASAAAGEAQPTEQG